MKNKTLKKLQEANQLKRIGSKRAGSWEVIIESEK